jgi:hypothetical protein
MRFIPSGLKKATWLMLGCLFLFSSPAHAVTVTLGVYKFFTGRLVLQVGSPTGSVDTVSFQVPAGQVGDNTPLQATSQPVRVSVAAQSSLWAEFLGGVTVTLTANSSTPLSNNTYTIPFTEIGWTSSDSDIPSGRFDGSANQVLLTFTGSKQVYVDQTFYYANSQVVAPGTYTGTVTYTATMQ